MVRHNAFHHSKEPLKEGFQKFIRILLGTQFLIPIINQLRQSFYIHFKYNEGVIVAHFRLKELGDYRSLVLVELAFQVLEIDETMMLVNVI